MAVRVHHMFSTAGVHRNGVARHSCFLAVLGNRKTFLLGNMSSVMFMMLLRLMMMMVSLMMMMMRLQILAEDL